MFYGWREETLYLLYELAFLFQSIFLTTVIACHRILISVTNLINYHIIYYTLVYIYACRKVYVDVSLHNMTLILIVMVYTYIKARYNCVTRRLLTQVKYVLR